jgi:hypothetical protein
LKCSNPPSFFFFNNLTFTPSLFLTQTLPSPHWALVMMLLTYMDGFISTSFEYEFGFLNITVFHESGRRSQSHQQLADAVCSFDHMKFFVDRLLPCPQHTPFWESPVHRAA